MYEIKMIRDLSFEDTCKIISDSYNNKNKLQFKYLEQLFTIFIEQLFMKIFNINHKPVVEMVENDEYNGSYDGYITIKINIKKLKEFQDGKALDLFETICHELRHFAQGINYKDINIRNSIMEKDEYLKDKIENYKDNNYVVLMVEVDAFLGQSKDAREILLALGITPSDEEIAISNARKEGFPQTIITNRIVGTKVRELDEIFEDEINLRISDMDEFDRENFLEFHPCINLEYNIIDNKVVRKSFKEIEQMYNDWLMGNIKLQGKSDEIGAYFKYIIGKFSAEEITLSSKIK